jgi:hypothetical protein
MLPEPAGPTGFGAKPGQINVLNHFWPVRYHLDSSIQELVNSVLNQPLGTEPTSSIANQTISHGTTWTHDFEI